MTTYTAVFTLDSLLKRAHYRAVESCDFWRFLVKEACQKATDFEIRCFADEPYGRATGETYGEQKPNFESKQMIFQGKVTPEFTKDILENTLTPNHIIKWQLLALYENGKELLASEYYGTGLILHGVPDEKRDAIRKYIHQFDEVRKVHFYKE